MFIQGAKFIPDSRVAMFRPEFKSKFLKNSGQLFFPKRKKKYISDCILHPENYKIFLYEEKLPIRKAADFTCCHVPAYCVLDQAHIRTSSYVQIEVSISYHIQARLWACGRGDISTPSFGSHLNPISTRGSMPTIYLCPHQVLKATGGPELHVIVPEFSNN